MMPPPRPTLIGLPYDASSSFLRGAAAAPPAIRAALGSPGGNLWSESLIDLGEAGVLWDAGDVGLPADPRAHPAIHERMVELLTADVRPLVLGGDHSVTWPVLRVMATLHPRLTVIQVDAHPDLYVSYQGASSSHASVFARVMEERLAGKLIQVGIRASNAGQAMQARRFGVETIGMRAWEAGQRPDVTGPVYLSIDVDGIDPAHAPGVSHPEPGGLTPRDVIGLIQSLPGPVVGADLVEFNPSRDSGGLTAVLCAKLVKELAARMIETSAAG